MKKLFLAAALLAGGGMMLGACTITNVTAPSGQSDCQVICKNAESVHCGGQSCLDQCTSDRASAPPVCDSDAKAYYSCARNAESVSCSGGLLSHYGCDDAEAAFFQCVHDNGAGGGGGSGSTTTTGSGNETHVVSGIVDGSPINVVDTVFTAGNIGGSFQELFIKMSDHFGTCGHFQANEIAMNTTSITLSVAIDGQTGGPAIGPGTYSVGHTGDTYLDGGVMEADPTCNGKVIGLLSGSLTITKVTETSLSGSFDLVLDSGDHITSVFGADNCVMDVNDITTDQGCAP